MDLHAGQIQGFFNIPVDNLYATPVLLPYMREHYGGSGEDLVIVSPDAGGVERARAFAKRLNAELAVCDKRRPSPNQAEVMRIVGDVKGKIALIVDDMIDTGGTIIRATEALLDAGAVEVSAFATHAVLSGNAVERLSESPLREIVLTDTIDATAKIQGNPKFKILTVGELLGEAILRIYQETSVSSLFV
jgi:ribose-phosphate pyrophosphokinase